MDAGVEDRDDVGMRERSDGLRFALEAGAPLRVVRERRRQDLDGDVAAQPRVFRAIHLAHAAGADRGDDFIRTEACFGQERQECGAAS